MNCLKTLIITLSAALVAAPLAAQEYWEYAPSENEWELHRPTEGMEYEYENGVEAEAEQYEWEAGEGYHEQEWYDPSDWFEVGSDIDYEQDDRTTYDYGNQNEYYETDYYAEDDSDYGWHYEPFEGDWEYGWHYDDIADYDAFDYDYDYFSPDVDRDYDFNQQVTGRVVGLERIRGAYGTPESVRLTLRTQDGQSRTLHLGDLAYVHRYLPRFEEGEEVVIGGERVNVNGRTVFRAKEIRSGQRSYLIPDYDYRRRIEGRLAGLRKVRTQNADVEAVMARVRSDAGETVNVLLGRADELLGQGALLRPGARVQVDGYRREVNGRTSFVVQDVQVLGQADGQQRQQQQQAERQQDQQNQRTAQQNPQGQSPSR